MRPWIRSAALRCGAGLVLLMAVAAPSAADMASPPFFVEQDEGVDCVLVNLGRKDLEFELQVRREGAVVQSGGNTVLPVDQVVTITYTAASSDQYWCHVLGRVKAKQVRASAQVRDSGDQVRLLVPLQ